MMPELTAKIFRTYNASKMFQDELNDINSKYDSYNADDKINIILDLYNRANIKVALLCNHQKNVSKSFNEQINKMSSTIKELKNKRNILVNSKKTLDKEDKTKLEKLKIKIKSIDNKIDHAEGKKELKLELKNLSLTTSKTNYIDPRITVAFFKHHKIPIDKIFSQALRDKFFWSFDVPSSWRF